MTSALWITPGWPKPFGLEAVRVEQAKDLGPALKKALAAKGPVLLDVLTHPLDDTRAPVSKWIA